MHCISSLYLHAGTQRLIGDLMCLSGIALFSVVDVTQEFLVKGHSIVEYIGLLGLSASFVSVIQM